MQYQSLASLNVTSFLVSLSLYFPILLLPQMALISCFDSFPKVPPNNPCTIPECFSHVSHIPLQAERPPWSVRSPTELPLWPPLVCATHRWWDWWHWSAQVMASLITYLVKWLRFTCQLLCCCASLCVGTHKLLNLIWQWHTVVVGCTTSTCLEITPFI